MKRIKIWLGLKVNLYMTRINCSKCGDEFESYHGHSLCPQCYIDKVNEANRRIDDNSKCFWYHLRAKQNINKDSIEVKDYNVVLSND